jgi:hypothetical protein
LNLLNETQISKLSMQELEKYVLLLRPARLKALSTPLEGEVSKKKISVKGLKEKVASSKQGKKRIESVEI